MECPQCGHVSSEKAPKFCSECGQKLPSAATVQGDLKNDNTLVVSSTPEGKTEQGAVLREEEVLLSSTDPGKELEKPEESDSNASWTTQMSKKEKRRRKRQGTISSSEAPSSGLWSLDMPPSPGSHNSALPQNQAQQGGAASQPGHPLDTENMPMEDGFVHTEGSGSPLQGQAAERTDAQSNLAPSDLAEVKDLNTSKPSVDKGLPLDGGPALSAFRPP